jgi:hypothetical protein
MKDDLPCEALVLVWLHHQLSTILNNRSRSPQQCDSMLFWTILVAQCIPSLWYVADALRMLKLRRVRRSAIASGISIKSSRCCKTYDLAHFQLWWCPTWCRVEILGQRSPVFCSARRRVDPNFRLCRLLACFHAWWCSSLLHGAANSGQA